MPPDEDEVVEFDPKEAVWAAIQRVGAAEAAAKQANYERKVARNELNRLLEALDVTYLRVGDV